MDTFPRLDAVCDLMVPEVREWAGLHRYDGLVQDLSIDGVRRGLARLGGAALDDPHDEAHLTIAEDTVRVQFGELELHRRNLAYHVANLDLACYDRPYAPEEERDESRRHHALAWPDAVDAAIESLDLLPAATAAAMLPAVHGLRDGLPADPPAEALAAHHRLVEHVEHAAEHSEAPAALGGDALALLLATSEGMTVDLDALVRDADAERDRLTAMLTEACTRLRPGVATTEVVAELVRDHPDADGVLTASRELTAEVLAWTTERQLVPYDDGDCLVEPSPPSRKWAMAMMATAAPWEDDGPSYFQVTPPDDSLSPEHRAEWLQVFSAATLPAIALHEVAPGHFSHGRALRHAPSAVRRTLLSLAFVEGWAHYAEELAVEEGFRADDPRFVVGVAVEALIRVTRLACAVGVHTGAMTVDDATRRFEEDAFLRGPAARAGAERATHDPTYGRYTWGKLAIIELREAARARWGDGFTLRRFHTAMLDLGSPPLGLLATALDRG